MPESNVSRIRGYLRERPNRHIHLEDIKEATGLTAPQVQGAISNIRNREGNEFPIKIVQPGQVWMLDTNDGNSHNNNAATPQHAQRSIVADATLVEVGDLYEEVGRTKDGDAVVRRRGTLFVAKEL